MRKDVIRVVRDYKKARKSLYPPLEDFVDAYYHMLKGDTTLMDQYMSKVDAVKSKIPKLDKTNVGG